MSAIWEWNTGTSRVAAVARGVPVALQLDEDDVGLVDAALRMLLLVVGHLDRDGGVLRLLSSFSSLPVSGQRGRVSTEGVGLGVGLSGALGVGLGAEVCTGAGSPDGLAFVDAATPTPTPAAAPTPTIPNRTARRLTCAIDVLHPPQPCAARQLHGKWQNR